MPKHEVIRRFSCRPEHPSTEESRPGPMKEGTKHSAAATITTSDSNAVDDQQCPLLLLQPAHLRLYGVEDALKAASPPKRATHDKPRKRERLHSAPPEMSARCQIHPTAMASLGSFPGDPVLVLVLARGWAQRQAPCSDDHCVDDEMSRTRGGREERRDGQRQTSARGVDVATREREDEQPPPLPPEPPPTLRGSTDNVGNRDIRGGLEHGDLESGAFRSEGFADVEGSKRERHNRTVMDADGEHNARVGNHTNPSSSNGLTERGQAQEVRGQFMRVSESAKLHCLLCTVWSNPRLTPSQVAVDGRVSVPLENRPCDYLDGDDQNNESDDEQSYSREGVLDQVGEPAGIDDGRVDDATVSAETGEDVSGQNSLPPESRFLTRFMELVARLETPPDDKGHESGVEGDAVVGVIPLLGGDTTASFRGGNTVPLAGRISAHIIPSRTRACNALATMGGKDIRTVSTTENTMGVSGVPSLLPSSSSLPPTYTSFVKRSLRHLMVCDGCEVAVPACPGQGMDVADSARVGRRDEVGVVETGVAFARMGPSSIVGGGGSVVQDPGYLTQGTHSDQQFHEEAAFVALMRGGVCAISPDSTILVHESHAEGMEGDAVRSRAYGRRALHGGKVDEGVGQEAQGKANGRRANSEGDGGSGKANVSMSPTDALVEVMLLPMTANTAGNDGATPLEFLIPRGVLLTGPPGVGKTYAVRRAVETVRNAGSQEGLSHFEVRLTTLNGAEILSLGQWEACEALRDAFSAAHNWSKGSSGRDARGFSCGVGRRCAVIFLDEADALLARRDIDGDKAAGGEGARALAQLLTLMDGFHKAEGSHVIVLGATNRPGALDPALRRPGRFDREIALAPPDLAGRTRILRHHLKGLQVMGGDSTTSSITLKCVGYVGADLAALAREAALVAARRGSGVSTLKPESDMLKCNEGDGNGAVTLEDLYAAMEKVGASSLRGHQVTVPSTPWSDIGGMDEAKAKLRQAVEWPVQNKDAFARMGLTPPRGILLFGPPGCSKTTLVRAAATAAGATFVCLSGADVFSPYLGEAEAAIRQAFLLARNAAPALLFFDEIDAIVSKREGGNKGSSNSAESRVLATFLTEMDGVGSSRGDGVVVVGATNRPEAVDTALLRPGRFDQLVYAPLPDRDARRQIFEVHTRKMAVDDGGVDFHKLAGATEGFTGAEIEGVCREAAMSAIREVGFDDSRNVRSNTNSTGKHTNVDGGVIGGDTSPKTKRQATVTMRHLAAAVGLASRPGVTRTMIAKYEQFASGR